MHWFIAFFGPKTTPALVVLFFTIVPIAIWHHVHLIVHIVKTWNDGEAEPEKKSDESGKPEEG